MLHANVYTVNYFIFATHAQCNDKNFTSETAYVHKYYLF